MTTQYSPDPDTYAGKRSDHYRAVQAAIRQKFAGKVAQGNMEAAREAYEVVMNQQKNPETQHA